MIPIETNDFELFQYAVIFFGASECSKDFFSRCSNIAFAKNIIFTHASDLIERACKNFLLEAINAILATLTLIIIQIVSRWDVSVANSVPLSYLSPLHSRAHVYKVPSRHHVQIQVKLLRAQLIRMCDYKYRSSIIYKSHCDHHCNAIFSLLY